MGHQGASRRLMSIDALRGIAALAVLLSHVPHLGELGPRAAAWLFCPLDYGSRGVPLCLIISGFCIHLSVARQAAKGQGLSCDWAGFWRRRFRRLFPPYLAAILFSLIML